MNIVAILTESYALVSLWSLVAMILNAIDNPVSVIFIQCENFIRVSWPNYDRYDRPSNFETDFTLCD